MNPPDRRLTVTVNTRDPESFRTDTVLIRIETRESVYRTATPEALDDILRSIGHQLATGYSVDCEGSQ